MREIRKRDALTRRVYDRKQIQIGELRFVFFRKPHYDVDVVAVVGITTRGRTVDERRHFVSDRIYVYSQFVHALAVKYQFDLRQPVFQIA